MTRSFHFNISLTVLNSLGRDLYRSVNTILGEAISNSWDADAHNVHVYIDRDANNLIIKDDGIGMDEDDFQNKFLKIGYSKRKGGNNLSQKGRPYIGRKGIGKLALLSCSEKIHIISKKINTEYIGAIIDNTQIDNDINQDLDTQEHILDSANIDTFGSVINNHTQGTIIKFENLNAGIKNQIGFFRKVIALYYRFSLIDNDFNIYLNDELISSDELNDLVDDTQIFWMINDLRTDPLVVKLMNKDPKKINIGSDFNIEIPVKGFIASVKKPSDIKMRGAIGEKLTIDLFVNGRMREKDILRHVSINRIYENYLYGQIHFDNLDDEKDRFTSSREGIKADDEKFLTLLNELKINILPKMADEWDKIRLGLREEGDPENPRKTPKQRKAQSLYNEVAKDYTNNDNTFTENETIDNSTSNEISNQYPEHIESINTDNNDTTITTDCIKEWVEELSDDAVFNVESYTECFISENLVRKYINQKSVELSQEAKQQCEKYRNKESTNKNNAGISIDIRQNDADESYLDMDGLANLVDKPHNGSNNYETSLCKKAKEYKPVRDAVMHTSLITEEAKRKLTTVYDDIKARLKNLFYGN